MEKIFKISSFFDEARWGSFGDEDIINFYKDLNFESKILTHWISYITDRQMNVKRIWDVGGFIFSELVDNIITYKEIGYLKPKCKDTHMTKRDEYEYKDEFKLIKIEEDKNKYIFISHTKTNGNVKLINFGFESKMEPYFASRFFPSDYQAILRTFLILEKFDFSFYKYIERIINLTENHENKIKLLLFGLYILTYKDIEQIKYKDIDNFDNLKNNLDEEINIDIQLLDNSNKFLNSFKKFKKKEIYEQKRAWCALRDLLKFPNYNKSFIPFLKKNGFNSKDINLAELELPGDVWNNNSIFRDCILKGIDWANDNKKPFNRLLREIYVKEEIEKEKGYPEQFDITFDFVPRMCEKNNCSICIYGKVKNNGKEKEFEKTCINDTNKYCPVALSNCGYKIKCKGENCDILNLLN